jgi:hypothetical protein
MSKESVNRILMVVALLAAFFLDAAAVRAQVALVVGVVRDQHGNAIPGARVSARAPSGEAVAAAAADGTFVLNVRSATSVNVTCPYCARARFAVHRGQPVIAIVHRYDALVTDGPSPSDLRALPYAHVESALALTPFTLLRQTRGIYPGSQLSARGLQPANALTIDAGVPDYDVAFGFSPYALIPAQYVASAAIASPSQAFLYGDRAGSGTVTLSPFSQDDVASAGAGGDAVLHVQTGSGGNLVTAGTSSNGQESRQRADASLLFPLSTAQSIELNAGSAQGREYADPYASLAGSFSFAHAAFDDVQPSADVRAALSYDRGNYAAVYDGLPSSDLWSDADFSAGVETHGAVRTFADVGMRSSSGLYDAPSPGTPPIAGLLVQNRADAGVESSLPDLDVTAGVGLFAFRYAGGSLGYSHPSNGTLAAPSLALTLFPQSHWNASLSGSDSFVLPTLWQQYAYPGGLLTPERASLYEATLTYTDLSRLRVSLEGASQQLRGAVNRPVTSSGVSLAWQVAPAVALRAWTMVAGQAGAQPNVGALWLTYEAGTVRADAVYRKDLLGGLPFYHTDGDVSGPIVSGVRWYAGVEDRLRARYLDAGLRFAR